MRDRRAERGSTFRAKKACLAVRAKVDPFLAVTPKFLSVVA